MARDANGNYSLPSGNPPTTGTDITVTWANSTFVLDMGPEIQDSLSRSGKGGMLAPLKLTDGSAAAPALSFSNETTSGVYRAGSSDLRVSVAGTDALRFNGSAALEVWRGGAWAVVPDLTSAQTFAGIQTYGAAQRAADGSAGVPAYSFTSDIDTGLWLSGAGILDVTVAGTTRLSFKTTAIENQSGSGSLPAYSFSGDPDTGVYRIGANNLGLTAGGVLALDINTARIATKQPVQSLDESAASPAYSFASATDAGMYYGSSAVRFAHSGAEIGGFYADSLRMASGKSLQAALGSAAAPGLTFVGDTDTGFYRALANVMGVAIGGTLRAEWRSTGLWFANSYGVKGYTTAAADKWLLRMTTSDAIEVGDTARSEALNLHGLTCGVYDAGLDSGVVRIASYQRKNGWTKGEYTATQTVTASATTQFDANTSNSFYCNVSTNITTFTLSNISDGQTVSFLLNNSGTNTIAWPVAWVWIGGVVPTFTSGAGKKDLLTVSNINGTLVASILQDVS